MFWMQKNVGPKNLGQKNKGPKKLVPNIFGPLNFGSKTIWGPTNFQVQKGLASTKFWTKQNFDPRPEKNRVQKVWSNWVSNS